MLIFFCPFKYWLCFGVFVLAGLPPWDFLPKEIFTCLVSCRDLDFQLKSHLFREVFCSGLNGGPHFNLGNCEYRLILQKGFWSCYWGFWDKIILDYTGEPKSNDKCLPKRHTERHRREGHVKTEAEIGVTQPQVKKCLRCSVVGKGKKGFFSRALRGLLTPWIWTSGFQNIKRVNLCCFKPSCIWSFF